MGTNILAVGMTTALGLDWETSCAASRAGIARAGPLKHFRMQGLDAGDRGFAVGHQADLLTQGFEGRARLVRLLAGALKDLGRKAPGDASGSLSAYLSLPHPCRTSGNIELLGDETARAKARQRLAEAPATRDPGDAEALLSEAAGLARWPGRLRLATVSRSGRAGMVDTIQRCLADLAAGEAEIAVAGAADSLLDDETLAWLSNTGRLKNPAQAAGLVPGEAAILFLLSRRAKQDSLGTVESLSFGAEDRPLESGQAPLGRGLAGVVCRLAEEAGWPGQDRTWIVSDHNGENYAAADWGWARHRLTARVPLEHAQVWFPAISFGDTGAAGAAAAMACALAAWKRGYAPASRCCILASQDDGRRAGLLLSTPQGGR